MELSRRHWLAVCASTAVAGGSSPAMWTDSQPSADGGDWRMVNYGPAQTSHAPTASLDVDAPGIDWFVPIPQPNTSPIVANGMVIAGGSHSGLRAFDQTGSTVWIRNNLGENVSTPAIAEDGSTLFVSRRIQSTHGGPNWAVRALDATTGVDRWQTTLPGSENRGYVPTATDGAVYVRTRSGVIALEASDGSVRWRLSSLPYPSGAETLRTEISPAISGDMVVVPDADGITAIDRTDHSIVWRKRTGMVRTTPAIAGSTVYFADVMAGVYALDLETGDQRWGGIGGTGVWTPPAVGSERVYFGTSGNIIAVNASDGSSDWLTSFNGGISAPIAVGDGFIVAGPDLAIVDADGEGRWFSDEILWRMYGNRVFSPALANATVYATVSMGLLGGGLYAIS